jgi:O-antigen/teichoic acid export membrane protein
LFYFLFHCNISDIKIILKNANNHNLMRLSTKVAYNTIIQTASKSVSTLLGLAALSVMARYLGTDGYGEYTTIITFLSFFAVVIDFGLTLVTVQMINQAHAKEDAVAEKMILDNLFAFRLVTAVIFLGLAPLIVIFMPYGHSIKTGVGIASFSFLFIALNQIFVGLFQSRLRMDRVAIAEVASRVALVAGIVLAAKLHVGLSGVLLATVVSSAISFFLHYYFSLDFQSIRLSFDFVFWRELVAKSWPIALTIAFNLIYLRTDTLILSFVRSQTDVGLYGAAYKVIDVLITLPFMFAGITLPILTRTWQTGDRSKFKEVLQRSFDLMVLLAVPVAVGAQFTSTELMVAVAGNEFFLSGPIMRILIFASSIIFVGCMFSHAVIAIDQQKAIIKAYVFTAATSLLGYMIFIPLYSYYGAAWVTIYSEAAIAYFSFRLVKNNTQFIPDLVILFKSLIASAVMASVLAISNGLVYFKSGFPLIHLAFTIMVSALTYFLTAYFLKAIKKEDLTRLMNKNG